MAQRKTKRTEPRTRRSSAYGTPDDDIPEMMDADFARAKPVREMMPELIEAANRARGRPKLQSPKQQISIRLDPGVIEGYRSLGPGWQKKMNEVLQRGLGQANKNAITAVKKAAMKEGAQPIVIGRRKNIGATPSHRRKSV